MTTPVTIIMIEDDEGHARLIERNIRRSGVNNEIVAFSNGTDAMKHLFGSDGSGVLHKGRALLILLDLNLPDMTGIEILRQIKDNKYLKATPVVVLTTSRRQEDVQQMYAAGANTYIEKPQDFNRFVQVLRIICLYWLETALLPPSSDEWSVVSGQ